MANNVPIPTTVGSTTTIESIDEGGGVARQVITIGSIGKAGSETQLTGGQKTSANSIPIVIASDQSAVQVNQPDVTSTGNTINSATINAAYTVSLANGEAAVGFTISGLTASGATLTLEGSAADGTTFSAINEIQASGAIGSTLTTDGNYYVNTGGRTKVRLRVSVIGTGTITIASLASSASSRVTVQASLPPGQNTVGNVGGKTISVTVTPTVTASNAYGTNYVVGGLLTFSNAFTSTGSGILQAVVMTIKDVETSGFTFIPFNGNPSHTTWTDAAVAAINANDVSLVREPVALAANSQLGTHTVAYATGLAQAMAPGSTTLYGVLIANAALTNNFGSTSDVTVTVKVIQDL